MNHDGTIAPTNSASELASRLQAHPNILAHVLSLLDIVENTDNNCETASDTELSISSSLQKLGNDALQDWANSQQKKKALACEKSQEMRRQRKKRLYWHSLFGTIQVIEQTYYHTIEKSLDLFYHRPKYIVGAIPCHCNEQLQILERMYWTNSQKARGTLRHNCSN